MTPALTTVWLDQVPEARSWLYFLRTEPHGALAVAVLLAGAVAFLAHRLWRERRAADAFYLAVLVLSLPLAFRFMKYLPYASLLAVPPLAMLIASLPAVKGLSAPTVRLAAFLAGNQLALMMVVLELVPRFGLETVVSHQTTPAGASGTTAAATGATPCFNRDNLAALNTVPPGLIFAPIDLGAHVIADTHHAVLAGPYHRLGPQILETHVILSTPSPADAETRLRRMGARYVLICPAITKLLTPVGPDTNTFDARLRRGEAMPFLEPIALPAGSPFRLWRRIAGGRP